MKKIMFLLLVTAVLASCTKINAGYEGIKVKQYGTDRGVQDIAIVTGRVHFNPWVYDIYEFPTFVQTVHYDQFSMNAADGPIFQVDPVVSYHIKQGMAPHIFVKYRQNIEDIQNEGIIYNDTKDAFKNVFNSYTADSILGNRVQFDSSVTALLTVELEKEGFIVDQVTFGMRYPETMTRAIEEKSASIQKAQQAENELRTEEANAKKLIVKAQGEAEANRLRQQSLTPLLIQQQFISKWDGSTPLYGTAPTLFQNVNK